MEDDDDSDSEFTPCSDDEDNNSNDNDGNDDGNDVGKDDNGDSCEGDVDLDISDEELEDLLNDDGTIAVTVLKYREKNRKLVLNMEDHGDIIDDLRNWIAFIYRNIHLYSHPYNTTQSESVAGRRKNEAGEQEQEKQWNKQSK